MSETYLTIGSDTGHTEIDRRTFGHMLTDVDYNKHLKRIFKVSLKRDGYGFYDFEMIDKHTNKGLRCKVEIGKGFVGSCKPIGDVEVES